jgi:hypothetical protein
MSKNSESDTAAGVAEELRGIEQRLAAAWIARDRSYIEQTLADDWSVIDLTGRILNKAAVLKEAFQTDDRKIVSMQIDEVTVRSFEDWAIVRGRTRAAGEYQGETAEVALRFTDIFARRNGGWKVIASQATLISE